MPIEHIHTFVVHPARRDADARHINGAAVPPDGKMFELLNDIYSRSEEECDIEIAFRPDKQGRQANPARDLIVDYIRNPIIQNGRAIAARLESFTDRRSGLGLLFIIGGLEGRDRKIVISRFPTDSAILADEGQHNLTVQFLDRVFMKSKNSYKAVAYHGASLRGDFWDGKAIDKQIGGGLSGTSNYWVEDFLCSDFLLTPEAGTRRLATALRDAAKKATLDIKSEIVSVVTLAENLGRRQISVAEFAERFGLSPEARQAINAELRFPSLAIERFRFDATEFNQMVGYRSVELDNGGVLTAPSAEFNEVFERHIVNQQRNEVRFSTQGTIVGQKLGKGR